jgi:hypothetical protein
VLTTDGIVLTVRDLNEQTAIDRLAEQLTGQYPNLGADEVAAVVHESHERFTDSRIRDYVPLFVERRARQTLAELAT